jgi:hypothetical protein
VLFNLFVSNIPGPQLPLYIAGARVEGVFPVSAVTDLTGGLNITLFSYDGSLDFGLIACREMVPDVWNLIGYLKDAMEEMLRLVADDPSTGRRSPVRPSAAARTSGSEAAAGKKAAAKTTGGRSTKGAKKAAGKKTTATRSTAKRSARPAG